MYSSKLLVDHSKMFHGADHLADSTAHTFHFVAFDEGSPFGIGIVLLPPALCLRFHCLFR